MEIDESPLVSETASNAVILAHQSSAVARVGGVQRSRQTMGEVMNMTFEEKRDELVASYALSFPKLAEQLATATTSDEAWAILNSQETRHVTEEEIAAINDLALCKKADAMDDDDDEDEEEKQRLVEAEKARLRAEAFEKYGVVDKKTGERVMADFNNEEHRAQLRERMSLFIAKTREPQDQDRLEAAAAYALHMAESRKAPTLTKEQAEHFEKSGELPADFERRREARMQRHMQMVESSRMEYNRIVALSDKESTSSCMPHKMPFAPLLKNALPLSAGFFTEAMQRFAKETRMSLTMSNMYPTLVYESKLRLLMYGSGAPNVATSFRYHETMHAMFMAILGTNKKLNHGAYLAAELDVCKKMQTDMRTREQELKTDTPDAEKAEIERAKADVVTFAHGLALAQKALAEEPPRMLSPFAGFLQRETKPWIELDVPRHSKEQIIEIVQYLQETERQRQNRALNEIERAFRESPPFPEAQEWQELNKAHVHFQTRNGHTNAEFEECTVRNARLAKIAKKRAKLGIVDTEEFLKRFWLHNHISTVNTSMCYDTGLLFMFEENIPPSYRADLALRVDMVDTKAIVFPSVTKDLARQRQFYAAIRRHYTERMTELFEEMGLSHLITHAGVNLDGAWLAEFGHGSVLPEDHASPTFSELAEFYYIMNKNYGSVTNVARMVDFVDEAYAAIYKEDGTLVDDFEHTLSDLRLRVDTQKKKRRM